MEIEKCSKPQLHNFPDMNSLKTKCLDCGKTIKEVHNEYMQRMNDEGISQICFIDLDKKPLFIDGGK